MTCPLNVLYLTPKTVIAERYKLWSSSLWSLLHFSFSSLLGANIRLKILFSNTLSLIRVYNTYVRTNKACTGDRGKWWRSEQQSKVQVTYINCKYDRQPLPRSEDAPPGWVQYACKNYWLAASLILFYTQAFPKIHKLPSLSSKFTWMQVARSQSNSPYIICRVMSLH